VVVRGKLEIEVPSTPSRLLRLSTEMLTERERFSAFREEFARRVLMMDVIDHSEGRPRIDITFMPLGPVAAGSLSATPAEFIRDKRHLKDRSEGFVLQIVETGPVLFTHVGQERAYEPGWAHFVDQERPLRALGPGQAMIRNIAVQAPALKTLVPHPEDLAGRAVSPGPALNLLVGYLRSLAAVEDSLPVELAPIVGGHLIDLVAAALGPTTDAAELVATRGVKAARLRAILATIERQYADPDLELDDVARTLGLSRRYIQHLLEETGKSFTEHVAERRLQRAYAMLTDPRFAHLRIIDIVLAVGFGDVSHFNRQFRRRFGDSPSGVRVSISREA
jgi:AraC-like DNA-binding protein